MNRIMRKRNLLQFCSAKGWAEKALKSAQWHLENGLTALSLHFTDPILSSALGCYAYIFHLIGLMLYPQYRPKDGIDWLKEGLNASCFVLSALALFGVTIPLIIQQVAFVVTLVLLFDAIADKLTA